MVSRTALVVSPFYSLLPELFLILQFNPELRNVVFLNYFMEFAADIYFFNWINIWSCIKLSPHNLWLFEIIKLQVGLIFRENVYFKIPISKPMRFYNIPQPFFNSAGFLVSLLFKNNLFWLIVFIKNVYLAYYHIFISNGFYILYIGYQITLMDETSSLLYMHQQLIISEFRTVLFFWTYFMYNSSVTNLARV